MNAIQILFYKISVGLIPPEVLTVVWPRNPYLALRIETMDPETRRAVVQDQPMRLVVKVDGTCITIRPSKMSMGEVDLLFNHNGAKIPGGLKRILMAIDGGTAIRWVASYWLLAPEKAELMMNLPLVEQQSLAEKYTPGRNGG